MTLSSTTRLLLTMATSLAISGAALADPVSFGLFGDTPYRDWERANLPNLIKEMDAEPLAFIVHDGDIKNGSSVCSDAVFADILSVFQASKHPLIFVLGDNEWTDCHRKSNGAYDPLERLAKLRQIFHADAYALGQRKLVLERQSKQPAYAAFSENTRWLAGDVLMVGLNVPGSDNGIVDAKKPSTEYIARNAANLAWVAESFAIAKEKQLAGIMLVIQANPELENAAKGKLALGYEDFLNQLAVETAKFNGQVVLVHGDTHSHRIDKPWPAHKNFTRVETYGSPFLGWVKVTADRNIPGVFKFESRPYTAMP